MVLAVLLGLGPSQRQGRSPSFLLEGPPGIPCLSFPAALQAAVEG